MFGKIRQKLTETDKIDSNSSIGRPGSSRSIRSIKSSNFEKDS